jgi:transposase
MTEKRNRRSFSPDQKLAIVLAGLRGDRSVLEVCREYEISDGLFYAWRDQLLEAAKDRFAGPNGVTETQQLRQRVSQLERSLGRKTYELEIASELSRGWE